MPEVDKFFASFTVYHKRQGTWDNVTFRGETREDVLHRANVAWRSYSKGDDCIIKSIGISITEIVQPETEKQA